LTQKHQKVKASNNLSEIKRYQAGDLNRFARGTNALQRQEVFWLLFAHTKSNVEK
jgi:hypothetical protein